MKVSTVFILILLINLTYCQTNIVLGIDPDDLQKIAELLVENYITHNVKPRYISTTSRVLAQLKKVSSSTLQLFGITMSLVGANLLTSVLDPKITPTIVGNSASTIFEPTHAPLVGNITSVASTEACEKFVGCDGNVCWRSCYTTNNNTKSWCYTSPNPAIRDYHRCNHAHECSPCWECISACQTGQLLVYWFDSNNNSTRLTKKSLRFISDFSS